MIIIAFFIGLIFSVPIGPLGMIMLKRSKDKGFWAGFSIVIIDSVAGFMFSLFFLIGIGQIEFAPNVKLIAQIIGLLFLLYIGIKEVFLKNSKSVVEDDFSFNGKSLLSSILLVIGYYISNPTIWAFWINISVYANSNIFYNKNLIDYFLFSFLFALGSLTTQYISIKLMKNIVRYDKAAQALKYISSGLFVTTFGYFSYKVFENILGEVIK